ncbi:MAG: anti-sigma factor antagonist [Clostridiales bacterium]|nr:anti-sigma factor antagonist [Candidatus Crickella caballi]
MKHIWNEETLIISLSGHVDSSNAPDIENELRDVIADKHPENIIIDAESLDYISSAGLRLVLKLRKGCGALSIINVNPDVYGVLEMTGFTEMMDVSKTYRKISVEGCEAVGCGANGIVYRIDNDNVVKVYYNPDALDDIHREREVAKLALILGVPTAISYEIVRVGESYGSVFELLHSKSFSKILAEDPNNMDWCVREYVEMLKLIHSTEVPEGKLPDMRETVVSWAEFMKEHLPQESGDKLMSLVEAVPKDNHMIHGDYHSKNLVLQDDEVLLIDMDTLAVGYPVFELASIYNAYIGFYELDPDGVKEFQGFSYEVSCKFWNRVLKAYLGTEDEELVRSVEDKARIIGYTRLIR